MSDRYTVSAIFKCLFLSYDDVSKLTAQLFTSLPYQIIQTLSILAGHILQS